jgi:hypothetical protein
MVNTVKENVSNFSVKKSFPDGTQEWYQDGLRHRTDGPAILHPDGSQEWCQNGVWHRVDGPARIVTSGRVEWWQDGLTMLPEAYKENVTLIAEQLCEVENGKLANMPFSQIESLVYVFNGWRK